VPGPSPPAWGPRKIHALLSKPDSPPQLSISTIAQVLKRNDRIQPEESIKHKAWQRSEAQEPNDLWQMDFKGNFELASSQCCHPFTVLDDHSCFLLGLRACLDETWPTVQLELSSIFQRYGLPQQMIFDNGSPRGSDYEHHYAPLSTWLIRLGISLNHSCPGHPRTLGKDERLHRTLSWSFSRSEYLGTWMTAKGRLTSDGRSTTMSGPTKGLE
jgi:transposase InsO family protein